MTNTSLWLALILALALVVRMASVLVTQAIPVSGGSGYDVLGWSLATGSGFVDSEGIAYWPVGYPAFLAVVYTAFGHSLMAVGIAQAVLGTITVGLTYVLSRLMLPNRIALIAALVVSLWPSHIVEFTPTVQLEVLHTVIVLSSLLLTYWAIRLPSFRSAVLLGLCIGISVHVRPILLLFPIVFGTVLAFQPSVSLKKTICLTSLAALVMLGTILPWTIRNYVVLDSFVLTATNGGVNLLIGSGPGATGRYHRIDKSMFSDTSEMTIYRESIDLTIEHVLSDPLAWVRLIPAKVFYLWAGERGWAREFAGWFADDSGPFQGRFQPSVRGIWWFAQLHWGVIVFMAVAAIVTRPMRYWIRFPAVLLPGLILYWTAFHMPFFGEWRFHVQMIPVIVVIAAHLLAGDRDWLAWARPFRRGRDSPDVNADNANGRRRPLTTGRRAN